MTLYLSFKEEAIMKSYLKQYENYIELSLVTNIPKEKRAVKNGSRNSARTRRRETTYI